MASLCAMCSEPLRHEHPSSTMTSVAPPERTCGSSVPSGSMSASGSPDGSSCPAAGAARLPASEAVHGTGSSRISGATGCVTSDVTAAAGTVIDTSSDEPLGRS